jgi:hypothetical protein
MSSHFAFQWFGLGLALQLVRVSLAVYIELVIECDEMEIN